METRLVGLHGNLDTEVKSESTPLTPDRQNASQRAPQPFPGSPEAPLTYTAQLAAAIIRETASTARQADKNPGSAQSLSWQGTITWSWGQSAHTRGCFTGALHRAGIFPAGSKWCNAGRPTSGSWEQIASCLKFDITLQPSRDFAQQVAEAWSGNLLLLYCEHQNASGSREDGPMSSMHSSQSRAASTKAESVCMQLQHVRLTGLLQGSGMALLAQGVDQGPIDSEVAAAPSLPPVKEEQASDAPNGINLLLVSVEHLQAWLPSHVLDKQQLALVTAQANTHHATICALPLMQQAAQSPEHRCMASPAPHQYQQQPQQQQQLQDIPWRHDGTSQHTASTQPAHEASAPAPAPQPRTQHPDQSTQARLEEFHACCDQVQPAKKAGTLARQQAAHKQAPTDQQIRSLQQHYEFDIINSILSCIRQLGLLPFDQKGMCELSQHYLHQLSMQPMLTQLRALAMLVARYRPESSINTIFEAVQADLCKGGARGSAWLQKRWNSSGNASCRLSVEAQQLQKQLAAAHMLAADAVPGIAAQVLPADLQLVYILCLGGYQAPRPLADFAADVMFCIAAFACHAAHQHPAASHVQAIAQQSLELVLTTLLPTASGVGFSPAGFSATGPAPGHSAMSADHAVPPASSAAATPSSAQQQQQGSTDPRLAANAQADQLDLDHILDRTQAALVQLGSMRSASLDETCHGLLISHSPLEQMLILSNFCYEVQPEMNASMRLAVACRKHSNKHDSQGLIWLVDRRDKRKGKPWFLGEHSLKRLEAAQEQGVLGSSQGVETAVSMLPFPLHNLAVCYAIGLFLQHPNDQDKALNQLKTAMSKVQKLVQENNDALEPACQAGQKRKRGSEQGAAASGKCRRARVKSESA